MTDVKPGDVAERLEEDAKSLLLDALKIGVLQVKEEYLARIPQDLRIAASLIRSLSERVEKLEELLAPMAACGRRIPEHAWDDDWYTLDGQDYEGEPFDKAEQKFLCSQLRNAAAALERK